MDGEAYEFLSLLLRQADPAATTVADLAFREASRSSFLT